MTTVNLSPSAAPPAQPAYAEVAADPPTIKNAGRLDHAYGPDILGMVLLAVMFGLLAIGPLLQAVFTSHGRSGRGMTLNAAAGVAALAVIVGASLITGGEIYWESIIQVALGVGVVWLFLAILAGTIGAIFKAPSRIRPRA